MSKPFFTVIIPTYNREKLLPRAIESVLAQTKQDFEIIVVDDGSQDNTKELVKKYKTIRYYVKEHEGVAAAKNFGIYKAKGEFITFLDSDDAYLPQHLKTRKEFLKEYDIVYNGFKTIGNEYVPDYFNPDKLIHVNKIVLGATFFIKKQVFQKIGKFKLLSYSEDTEFFYRAKAEKIKMLPVENKTYLYYRTQDSITANKMKTP